MVISLDELRIKINQLNTSIISGIKDRSRYLLSEGIYTEEFKDGLSWFKYRLKQEQNLDAEFGRFLYPIQRPLVFSREELAKPLVGREVSEQDNFFDLDLSEKIVSAYKELIKQICEEGEDKGSYGEITKLDVNNVLTLNERTVAFGEQVALYKIENDSELKKIKDKEKIKEKLVRKDRESEVIEVMKKKAQALEIENFGAIEEFSKKLINITLEAEIEYILLYQKNKL
jgi:hypothetical protein